MGVASQVVAGLNGATAGPHSGTATLTFEPVPGASNTTGTTAVGSGAIALTASGWNWADAQGDMLATVQPNARFTTYESGDDVLLNYSIQAVPEPETLVLAGLGVAIASFAARRRRSRQA